MNDDIAPPPPPLPQAYLYTSCYCEENTYLLCKTFASDPGVSGFWSPFVVFVSNENKTVALGSQKAARDRDEIVVVWDYHVILLLIRRPPHVKSETDADPSVLVYDFDTTLPVPCRWEEYLDSTFSDAKFPPEYQSKFRIIEGNLFLKHFASDRSHMLVEDKCGAALLDGSCNCGISTFRSPPPPYPPIQGPTALERQVSHNLISHYVDMVQDGSSSLPDHGDEYGVVLDSLIDLYNFFQL